MTFKCPLTDCFPPPRQKGRGDCNLYSGETRPPLNPVIKMSTLSIDTYTLFYLKWITNEDLLHSTGNSAPYYGADWVGGEFGGEWIHVYIWLNLFPPPKTTTTLLISYTTTTKSLQSCLTVQPHRRQPTRLLRPWDFPGKSTGVGCHCLLRLISYTPI